MLNQSIFKKIQGSKGSQWTDVVRNRFGEDEAPDRTGFLFIYAWASSHGRGEWVRGVRQGFLPLPQKSQGFMMCTAHSGTRRMPCTIRGLQASTVVRRRTGFANCGPRSGSSRADFKGRHQAVCAAFLCSRRHWARCFFTYSFLRRRLSVYTVS